MIKSLDFCTIFNIVFVFVMDLRNKVGSNEIKESLSEYILGI